MNKEEYIDNILLDNDRLYKENQQLHNKIDKAIEYIRCTFCCIHDEEILNDLLEILKDGDEDE